MTANLSRDGHVSVHVPTETRGTGDHQHRRAWIQHDGQRMGYNRCLLGTGDERACPDEPDPWVRLQAKADARSRPQVTDPSWFCDRHTPDRWRTYSGNRICLDCRSEKRRLDRIGRRIEREALRAA